MSHAVASPGRINEFLSLYARHESRIHTFILSLLPNWNDAEEVSQETAMVLWSKFDEFLPGSSYFAWACQIARFEVSRYLRQQHRDRLTLSDEILDAVTRATIAMDDELAARQQALAICVDKLPAKDRQLLELRHRHKRKAEEIASDVGRSIHAVYKAMKRIRRVLYDCVTAALAKHGYSP